MFIATQLNSTRRRVELSWRSVYSDTTQLNSTVTLSMNVVTQLTQFVGHDVINKIRLTWLYAVQLGQLSWVELCRYRHPSIATQHNSTRRRVELSCVAINIPYLLLTYLLNGGVEWKWVWKYRDFQPISYRAIGLCLQNDTRYSHSYYGRRMQAFEWCLRWTWVTLKPDFEAIRYYLTSNNPKMLN